MSRKFDIFHANPKGTGMALSIELYPSHDACVAKVILSFIRQSDVARETTSGGHTFPKFDYAHRNSIRLDPLDAQNILEVFGGYTESINDGKGLFAVSAENRTTFTLRHTIDPVPGYVMTLKVVKVEGGDTDERTFFISPTEAGMLNNALTASMGLLLFGE